MTAKQEEQGSATPFYVPGKGYNSFNSYSSSRSKPVRMDAAFTAGEYGFIACCIWCLNALSAFQPPPFRNAGGIITGFRVQQQSHTPLSISLLSFFFGGKKKQLGIKPNHEADYG